MPNCFQLRPRAQYERVQAECEAHNAALPADADWRAKRYADSEVEPVTLQVLDEELCRYLRVPCRERHYAFGWYDSIGLLFAMGRSMDEVVEFTRTFSDEHPDDEGGWASLAIALYLREYYVVHAWYQNR